MAIPSPAAFLILPVSFTVDTAGARVSPAGGSGFDSGSDGVEGVGDGRSSLGDGSGLGVLSGVDSTIGVATAMLRRCYGVPEGLQVSLQVWRRKQVRRRPGVGQGIKRSGMVG